MYLHFHSRYPTDIKIKFYIKHVVTRDITRLFLLCESHELTHFVQVLRHKPEGRGFDYPMKWLEFWINQIFQPHCGPGNESASNKNELCLSKYLFNSVYSCIMYYLKFLIKIWFIISEMKKIYLLFTFVYLCIYL